MPRIEVAPLGSRLWAVRIEGERRPISEHAGRRDAERVAHEYAQRHGGWDVVVDPGRGVRSAPRVAFSFE
jgi:hypothetical protein